MADADPAAKAQIYKGLNLTLTYYPERNTIRAEADLSAHYRGVMVGVRGPSRTISPRPFTRVTEFPVGTSE